MCVLAFAFDPQPSTSRGNVLRLISNRDEFLNRPTEAAHWWPRSAASSPNQAFPAGLGSAVVPKGLFPSWILGGRDLRAGGSWFAISRAGRVAILTNYRDPSNEVRTNRSRGDLVDQWVGLRNATVDSEDLVQVLATSALDFAGFNLLLFDCTPGATAKAWVISNRASPILSEIPPGIHGLSNEVLNSPWPKTMALKESLKSTMDLSSLRFESASLEALAQTHIPGDEHLPQTGIPIERERYLSSVFIKPPDTEDSLAYGTRCSTVMSLNATHIEFLERSFYPQMSERRFSFALDTQAILGNN